MEMKVQCRHRKFQTDTAKAVVYDVVDSYKSLLEKVMR